MSNLSASAFISELIAAPSSAAARGVLLNVPPYDAGSAITGDIAVDFNNGDFQKLTLTGATVAREFGIPTNGVDGDNLTLRIKSAAGVERTLTMNAGIIIPSDSGISWPKTLEGGKMYLLRLHNMDTSWCLISFVGGY